MEFIKTEVFRSYAYYSSILVIKWILMSFYTSFKRMTKQVVANPEDTKLGKGIQVKFGVEDIERIRRAHLNDIENITPFFIIGYLYCLTNPAAATATLLFKTFAFARIAHTFVYLFAVPQPSRALAFGINAGINIFMAYQVFQHFH